MTTNSPFVVDMHHAEFELHQLLQQVESGNEIVLSRAGAPVAKLVPLPIDFDTERNIPWEGKIWLSAEAEKKSGEILYASKIRAVRANKDGRAR